MKSLFHRQKEEQFLLLNALGPLCLNLGLSCALFKYAHALWPLVAASFLGVFLIGKWKKIGFICALALLAVALATVFHAKDAFWTSLLSVSIALSWLLMLLGDEEIFLCIREYTRALRVLQEKTVFLSAQHEERERVFFQEHKEVASSIESLKKALHSAHAYSAEQHARIEREEMEKEGWRLKADELSSQLVTNESAEEDLEETRSLDVLRAQYAQLKEQFEEKSEILHQTRKELFAMESQFLSLQKEIEENARSPIPEDAFYTSISKQLEEEEQHWEIHTLALEELVSQLLLVKKPLRRKRKSSAEAQEDLFIMAQES
ncbi:MAG TPA: hypothetical protein VGJ00_09025 [Rhabdochlamydiaceae bacterium]|jgi:hypothetical protein